jgi:hypothetical protein
MRRIVTCCALVLAAGAGTMFMTGCASDHAVHHEQTSQDMTGDLKKTSTDVYEKPDGGYRVEKNTTKVDQ